MDCEEKEKHIRLVCVLCQRTQCQNHVAISRQRHGLFQWYSRGEGGGEEEGLDGLEELWMAKKSPNNCLSNYTNFSSPPLLVPRPSSPRVLVTEPPGWVGHNLG